MVFHYKKPILYLQDSCVGYKQGKYSMIENKMPIQPTPQATAKKPNENGTISVQGFVKIFDPNTKEKFVEKRA